jgi:hypothetical protein
MPVTYIPNGDSQRGPDPAQMALMAFMQMQQNKADKERLKIQQDTLAIQQQEAATRQAEAAQRAQAEQGRGMAGIAELVMASAADPSVRSMLMQVAPQTMVNPQAIGQTAVAGMRGQASPAAGNIVRPQFDARQVPIGQAAALAEQVRGFRTNEADLRYRASQTTGQELSNEGQRLDNSLHGQRQRLIEAQIAAQNANTAESQAAISNMDRTYRVQLRSEALHMADADNALFAELSQTIGVPEAARTAYGSNAPISRDALAEEYMRFLDETAGRAQTSEEFDSLLRDRRRTAAAQRLGIGGNVQQAAEQALAQSDGDLTRAYALADETLDDDPLAQVYLYYRTVYPDQTLERPRKPSFWAAVRRVVSSIPAPASTSPAITTQVRP